ncbi:hypothetical protein F5148DRAFT_1376382 [Russula earlei]|uniref:Uncharacterized protein n=1 Tax=Russula earlei TaxID=71964 RepID=A0ACC0U8B1_9AGAM|nr:hypothetical protein F5148DRAFT_1376382 [Russula earlei]
MIMPQQLGDPPNPPNNVTPKTLEEAADHAFHCLEVIIQPDDDVNQIREWLYIVWSSVYLALRKAGELEMMDRLRDEDEFKAYVKAGSNVERELIELLRRMANKQLPWSDLFKNEAFLKPDQTDSATVLATSLAWGSEFKGDLADVLFVTIADYLSLERLPYPRLAGIVNSSGTGKSRSVDQLGKEIITVPMCLRRGSEGFPPPDRKLRNWLLEEYDRRIVQTRLYHFAYSLLVVTLRKLETIASDKQDIPNLSKASAERLFKKKQKDYVTLVIDRHKRLASAFREYMATEKYYLASNPHRRTFYDEVIELASDENERGQYFSANDNLQRAGERLCRFIDEHKVLESHKGPRRPLVVLAFDEAHVLIDNPQSQKSWNRFLELRRILREITDLPIFSLFLSTAACFNPISPEIPSHPSARFIEPNYPSMTPISEISFDDIAYPALKGTVTIDRVVGIDWISHLGRPLFGSFWDKLPPHLKEESVIMDYARTKLLNGPNELRDDNPTGTLACLSVRFALAFNSDVSTRDVGYAQVERHMLLCIVATAEPETLITIAGSEPLLAEAAYQLVKGTQMNAVRHLANHSDLDSIDRGRRGELVAALLIMQTYDAARAISRRRWVSVANFMEALLPTSSYEALLRSVPTSWPEDYNEQETFEEIFKDYGLWFNHVIKIESPAMISINHLWKFVTRGAMILCATNHEGIDIVLPVFHTTQDLGPDFVTAVVIQVKNTEDYMATLEASLFDRMDSLVKSAMFPTLSISDHDSESPTVTLKTTEPAKPKKKKRKVTSTPKVVAPELVNMNSKPVIRLVFALASPEPAVIFRERPQTTPSFDGFTTFDIWLAGISHETFKQIQDEDLKSYNALLERSQLPHDAFKWKESKNTREAIARRMAPLTLSGCSHHGVHLSEPKESGEGTRTDPGYD